MLHPSYNDLMNVVNEGIEDGQDMIVNSRYSIVLATAKRAREIIACSEPLVTKQVCEKPLSTAIQELNEGEIKILTNEDEDENEVAR